ENAPPKLREDGELHVGILQEHRAVLAVLLHVAEFIEERIRVNPSLRALVTSAAVEDRVLLRLTGTVGRNRDLLLPHPRVGPLVAGRRAKRRREAHKHEWDNGPDTHDGYSSCSRYGLHARHNFFPIRYCLTK